MEGQTVDTEDSIEKGKSVGIVQVDLQKTLADLRAEITQQIAQGGDELPPTFSFVEKLGDQLVEISCQEESIIRVKDLVGKGAEILIVEKPTEPIVTTVKKIDSRKLTKSKKKNSNKPQKSPIARNSKAEDKGRARNQREVESDEESFDPPPRNKNGRAEDKGRARNQRGRNSEEEDSDPPSRTKKDRAGKKDSPPHSEDMEEAWYTSSELRRQLRELRQERREEEEEDVRSVDSPRKPRKSRGRAESPNSRRDRPSESISPRPRDQRRRSVVRTKSRSRQRLVQQSRRQRQLPSSRQNTFRLPPLIRTSQAVARFERKVNMQREKEERQEEEEEENEKNEENESNGGADQDEQDERPVTVRIRRERSLTEEVRIPQVSLSGRRLPSLKSNLRQRSFSIDGGNSEAVEDYFTSDSPEMDEYFLNRQPFSFSALNLRELENKQITRYNNRFEMTKLERRIRGLLARVRSIEAKIKLLKSIGQEHWRGRFYQLRRNVAPLEERAKQLEDEEDELQENLIRLFELRKPTVRYTSLYANDFQKNALILEAQKGTGEITRLNNQLEYIDLDLLKYRKMRAITTKQAEKITRDICRENFLRHLFLGRTFQKD